jgi:hypothetical protein
MSPHGRACRVAGGAGGLFVVVLAASMIVGAVAMASSGPVPWLNVRPVEASGDPPLAAPCTASSLHAHLFLQGATGSLVGGISLRNVSVRPCSLLGSPRISFSGGGALSTKWQVKRLSASQVPVDVLADPPGSLRALAPGKSASVTVFWSNWCGPHAVVTGDPGQVPGALELLLSDGTRVSIPIAHAPRCDAPQDPSTISVSPFVPATRRLPESSRLPLRVKIVGEESVVLKPGLRAFAVRRAQLLHFAVAVTNTGRTSFHFALTSCPSYVEQVASAAAEVYILNCRPVSSIAAGRTVVFAMRIGVPKHTHLGNNSLTWELAPRTYSPPFTSAALAVKP